MSLQIRNLEAERMKRGWHLEAPDEYAANKHILSWWIPAYDQILSELIGEYGHGWHQRIVPELERSIPEATISAWRETDPLCAQYAYYNVLAYFAVARGRTIGLEHSLPEDRTVECRICEQPFLTSSLRAGVWRDLGVDFCGVCIARAFWLAGDPLMTRDSMLEYITTLSSTWERVPPQGVASHHLAGTPPEQRRKVVELLIGRPTAASVRETFGGWFEALIVAAVLNGASQRLARGTRCLANDGHMCLSIGEKTIDDLLYGAKIEHTREPPYPSGAMRADFKVGETLVEYFGLAGNADYDAKIERKRAMAQKHGVSLLEIYPRDLADPQALIERLAAADSTQTSFKLRAT